MGYFLSPFTKARVFADHGSALTAPVIDIR
jgi:hypothetical protein